MGSSHPKSRTLLASEWKEPQRHKGHKDWLPFPLW